jgi:hypothetical protein
MPRATFKNKPTSSNAGTTKRHPGRSGQADVSATSDAAGSYSSFAGYKRSTTVTSANITDAVNSLADSSFSPTLAFQAYVNHHRLMIKADQNTALLMTKVEELQRFSATLTYRHQLRYKWNTDREIVRLQKLIADKTSGVEARAAEAVIQKYVDAYNDITAAGSPDHLPVPSVYPAPVAPLHRNDHLNPTSHVRQASTSGPLHAMPNELRKRKSAGSKTAKDTKPLLGTVNDISLSTHLRNSFLLSTPSEQTTYNQESVQHELMSELENTAPPLYVVQGDVCHKCNIPLIILASDALLGCPRCSHTRLYIQATSSRIAYGEEVEFANFSYKRQNHFQVPQSLRLGETARACNY